MGTQPGTPAISGDGPHVFVVDVESPELDEHDRHHLARALRLRPGDPLTISDGRGAWRRARFGEPLAVDGPVVATPVPEPALTVAFALVKGSRPELAVQKLTELGLDQIVLFPSGRSVVRWDGERSERHLERLRRVAREAAMQSRRCRLPAVEMADDVDTVAALPGAVLADPVGRPLQARDRVVLVGPEGGWTAPERAGRPTVALGPTVLRAETAAIAAGVLLTALRHQGVRHAT